jgi:small subunit ribosomal protein S3
MTVYGKIGIKVWICKGEVFGKRDLSPNIGQAVQGGDNRGGNNRPDRRGGDRPDRRGGDRRGNSGDRRPGGNGNSGDRRKK